MNSLKKIVCLGCLVILLMGCGMSAKQAQLREQFFSDPYCSTSIKEAISEDKIRRGMTKDQVTAAWGERSWFLTVHDTHSSWGDTWTYQGYILFFDRSGHLSEWTQRVRRY